MTTKDKQTISDKVYDTGIQVRKLLENPEFVKKLSDEIYNAIMNTFKVPMTVLYENSTKCLTIVSPDASIDDSSADYSIFTIGNLIITALYNASDKKLDSSLLSFVFTVKCWSAKGGLIQF